MKSAWATIFHRRPQWRAHHAMESGSQRRLLARRSAAAVSAAHHGCGVRLSLHERRGLNPRSELAAQLTKRMLPRCKTSRAFGRGTRRFLGPATAKYWPTCASSARTRFCASPICRGRRNRSSLNLAAFKGRVPVEMLGRTTFPPIGELPYLLTISAHGFYWFKLATDAEVPRGMRKSCRSTSGRCWCCSTAGPACFGTGWCRGASASPRNPAAIRDRHVAALHRDPALVCGQRAPIEHARIADHVLWQERKLLIWLVALLEVAGGERSGYFMPLALAWRNGTRNGCATWPRRRSPKYASRRMSG